MLCNNLIDPLALTEKEGFVNKSNGKFQFFHDRIQEVLYSMIPEEQSMSTLGYASRISDSVEMGLDIMKKLGEELPRSFSDNCTEDRIKTTHTMLDEISVTKLLNYRMMTDKKKMMAMKFLCRLASVTHQVHPNLLPVVTLKMVELTIAHGMSSMSPIGFAYLGSLVAKLGNIKGGYKCASLAKSLVDKMNLKEVAGEVYWVSIKILCYIEPLPVANENQIDCEALALGAGDVTWACYSRLMYANGIFWSGSQLSVSADVYFRGRRFLMSQGHVTTENYLLLLQRSLLILIGADEGEFITDTN
ncbi:hypothetical protein HJC23_005402 [Cyclotella cryptica]|uniref:Uncharacterized protein n=1 Tax=Cyclotella cryptica TaxID=29204 RepID=A0ABD3P263_9STRA